MFSVTKGWQRHHKTLTGTATRSIHAAVPPLAIHTLILPPRLALPNASCLHPQLSAGVASGKGHIHHVGAKPGLQKACPDLPTFPIAYIYFEVYASLLTLPTIQVSFTRATHAPARCQSQTHTQLPRNMWKIMESCDYCLGSPTTKPITTLIKSTKMLHFYGASVTSP